ncbi:murein L,D-transpeptidase catalytic domain family protein [Sandarakinorhabdus sp. DWP1-3-1]|uniref:murein L,D-transpeptidase catalytic domain family protein n=1 Tax=Sandarakinorhabdus sp. DWP1-3-1 TaxID=2804627 RepID=UPI003CE87591
MTAVPARLMASVAPSPTLDPRLLARALASFQRHRAQVGKADVMAIADYSRPSRDKRFHLLDLASGATTSMLVAHGRGSDPAHSGWLKQFSNTDGSYASCNGAFVTGAEYVGKHGRSMRLAGLDASNCNAEPRAIVIHTAPYVTEVMARTMGKVGRSQGCFTLTEADLGQVMARLGKGRFLYSDKV